jgi:TATA-binding protein-associated factor Taf7
VATWPPSRAEHHKKSLKHKYQWPHGVTVPLKNVRKRRFRKTADKKVSYLRR